MNSMLTRLKLGGSTIALIAAIAAPAAAQDASAAGGVEQIVVTGTSIRGAAPVGSNVMTVDQTTIKEVAPVNISELLNTVTAITSTGAPPNVQNYSAFYSPNIHQIAGSASNSTLVIADGFRMPQGSEQHSQTDPNIIPTIALQRVEVLADGASSIYGSDAVSGVVNFITRDNFDGLELTGSGGIGGGSYNEWTASLLAGTNWGSGSALVAYQYTYTSDLAANARAYTATGNYVPFGGTNQNSFNCAPASLQPGGGTNNIFLSATATTSIADVSANAPCNIHGYGDLLPRLSRNALMVKGTQQFGRFTVTAMGDVSVRNSYSKGAPTSLTATVFSTGLQANPFYETPAGYTGVATSETIRLFTSDLGLPNPKTLEGSTTLYGRVGIKYNVDDNWLIQLTNVIGRDESGSYGYNGFCTTCAYLALNGTAQSNGSLTTSDIPGQNTITTSIPANSPPGTPYLTAATALDVWNPRATNRTSATTLASLINVINSQNINFNQFDQLRLQADGALFDLPAGPLKVAVGAENAVFSLRQVVVGSANDGPAGSGSTFHQYQFSRVVDSLFVEFNIPIIAPEMNVPLVEKFDVDISGRYDHITLVGATSNPKFATTWQVVDGLKLRGNYSTSFVAPSLDTLGDPTQNYNFGNSSVVTYSSGGAFKIAVSPNGTATAFPGAGVVAGVLPGCAVGATSCTLGSSSTPGIQFFPGCGPSCQPQKGDTWSVGIDLAPVRFPGFDAEITYWNTQYKGGITSPLAQAEVSSPGLQPLFTLCPTGCTSGQIASKVGTEPIGGALPIISYFIYDFGSHNVVFIDASGIDLTAQYVFDTDYGHFKIGDNLTEFTEFDYHAGAGSPAGSILNTAGFTTTFPSIQTRMRANVGWSNDIMSVDAFVNFTGSYRDWSGDTALTVDANGNPNGGGAVVHSNTTVDLHIAYNFPEGIFGGDQIWVDAKNLFDRPPPFVNNTALAGGVGYDGFVSSPLGRVTSIGIDARW